MLGIGGWTLSVNQPHADHTRTKKLQLNIRSVTFKNRLPMCLTKCMFADHQSTH